MEKAVLTVEGDNISIDIPFVKVDQEKRLVSGFATLDNVDIENDIVTQDASIKAFQEFRGNVREMHQPKAVGKVVAYRPDQYVDEKTGEIYNGIYVSAHVSKGAQDTWEKVLDGTLSGFSIGGSIVKAERTFDEAKNQLYRTVTDYNLIELSLVDNPANKFANVLFIQKSANLEETSKTAVHWCDRDRILTVEDSQESKCPACNKFMKSIGFVEGEPDKEALKGILKKFRDSANPKENEMAEETKVEKSEQQTADAQPAVDPQQITEIVDVLKSLSATLEDVKKSVADFDGVKQSVESVTAEIAEVKTQLATIGTNVEKFDARVEAVEAETAVKKSGDVGGVTEKVVKAAKPVSKFGGRFLPGSTEEIYR